MKKLTFILFIFLVMFSAGCKKTEQEQTQPMSRTEFLMGTVVTIKVFDGDMEKALDDVFQRLEELSAQITVNDDQAESLIMAINKNAGIEPVEVPAEIFALLKTAKEYSELSDGSFDVTIGPLTSLWRIGFPDARKPAQEEIEEVLPLIDYKHLILDETTHTAYLEQAGMKIDLGAIAKGFMTDVVVELLQNHDVTSAIIDLGGNIFVMGTNPSGEDWSVGVQDPFSTRGSIIGKLNAADKSVVTSGIYERYLEVDGETFHHLLNPQDGYPFDNGLAGVSVITDHSIDGDALSTILFAKGVDEGLRFAEELDGVEAIFITKEREVYLTSGLVGNFELTADDYQLVDHHSSH